MSHIDADKYDLDPSHAYLVVEARSQQAEHAFGLSKNAGAVVRPIEQSGTGSNIALQLTLKNSPTNPTAGYVFGSSEEDCDILLDTKSDRGVSSMAFRIIHERQSHDLKLHCLARNGIYACDRAKNQWKKVVETGLINLPPGNSWTIALGGTQIILWTVARNPSQQRAFDLNLNGYIAREERKNLDFGRLNTQGSTSSVQDTPATRFLTGIWGDYTAAGKVGEGGHAMITGCISKTGVTCCIKEAKATGSEEQLRQEIRSLRRVTHPSIVQYIDRDPKWTWMAIEFSELGNLTEQHILRPFSVRVTEVLIYQALDALSHIHSCNIIHHDIKGYNILVQIRTKNRILVKLADFGSCVRADQHPDKYKGTPINLAPECFMRPPVDWNLKIDVWALAIVALRNLFGWPTEPPVPESLNYSLTSPYSKGWGGSIQAHFDKGRREYLRRQPSLFLDTLNRMFNPEPEARPSALEASERLRKDYPSGYFFSLGMEDLAAGERTPELIGSVSQANSRSDDDSIFRFRELNVQDVPGFKKPLLMAEGCYLVNLAPILMAKLANKKNLDIEYETREVLKERGQMYWKCKLPGRALEPYIRIDHALALCKGSGRLQPLFNVLKEQRQPVLGKETQLSLVESIRNTDSIIAITEEGRMLLVRPKDGYIYAPSVQAVIDKRLLSIDKLGDKMAYMSLDGAMVVPRILSHNDIISLGAATYISF